MVELSVTVLVVVSAIALLVVIGAFLIGYAIAHSALSDVIEVVESEAEKEQEKMAAFFAVHEALAMRESYSKGYLQGLCDAGMHVRYAEREMGKSANKWHGVYAVQVLAKRIYEKLDKKVSAVEVEHKKAHEQMMNYELSHED